HREDLAGLRIERDQGAGAGAELAYRALELLLGEALQGGVDGQLDVRATRRRGHAGLVENELAAERIVADDQGLHPTPQLRIEDTFNALQALAVDVGEPEHVAGQRPVRVDALAGRPAADAAQAQLLDRLPALQRHLAVEPDER